MSILPGCGCHLIQIRVHWEPNRVVLWDNRCVQHHAAFDYFPAVRHGYRVTTIGEVPTLEAQR